MQGQLDYINSVEVYQYFYPDNVEEAGVFDCGPNRLSFVPNPTGSFWNPFYTGDAEQAYN